jgi:hypothetical protein
MQLTSCVAGQLLVAYAKSDDLISVIGSSTLPVRMECDCQRMHPMPSDRPHWIHFMSTSGRYVSYGSNRD